MSWGLASLRCVVLPLERAKEMKFELRGGTIFAVITDKINYIWTATDGAE